MDRSAGRMRLTALVSGQVQGVGFRWWTHRQAEDLGLVGSAVNLSDGRVSIVAEGPEDRCARLVDALRGCTPGHVRDIATTWGDATGEYSTFQVG